MLNSTNFDDYAESVSQSSVSFIKGEEGFYILGSPNMNATFGPCDGLNPMQLLQNYAMAKPLMIQDEMVLASNKQRHQFIDIVHLKDNPSRTWLTTKHRFKDLKGNKFIIGQAHDVTNMILSAKDC